jgi:hypothetical protein
MADEAVTPKSLAKRGFWSLWEDIAKEGGRWLFFSLLAAGGGLTALLAMLKVYWAIIVAVVIVAAGTLFVLVSAILAIRTSASAASGKSAAPAPGPAAPATKSDVTIFAPWGAGMQVKGIAFIDTPSISYTQDVSPAAFYCTCHVRFAGFFENAEASPHELHLTSVGGKTVLARMETEQTATRAGITRYIGRADLQVMGREILNSNSGHNGMLQVPIPEKMLVDIEVRLPSGTALAAHRMSGVKLDFEMVNSKYKSFRVTVVNEPNVQIGPQGPLFVDVFGLSGPFLD